jgi:serine/threonine protein kinase
MAEDSPSPALLAMMAQKGYVILSKIGAGRTASVYLIENPRWPARRFVVKQVDLRAHPAARGRELPILSSLDHRNVINIYQFFEEGGIGYFILEYCPGGSLMDLIKARGPLPPEQLYRFAREAATGLAYCHSQGISHGDIKPDNILLDAYQRCKLADFGLGQQVDPAVASTKFVGSLAFMAPEVLSRRAFDPFLADIWSLGVTLYWLARGKSPFRLDSPETLLRDAQCGLSAKASAGLPWAFARLLHKMIEPNPESRIALADVIGRLLLMIDGSHAASWTKLIDYEATKTMPPLAIPKLPRSVRTAAARSMIVYGHVGAPAKCWGNSKTFGMSPSVSSPK